MSLLKAEGLGIQFGGLKAVDEFNFEMDKDQLYGLIGPNGAGKTTVFNLLSGVYKPTSGQILFDGKSLLKMTPTQITQLGIARTFQNIRLFKKMSVIDNVKVGLHHSQNYSLLSSILHLPSYFKGEEEDIISNSFFSTECGITALLCADSETRKSYYLNHEEQKELNNKEIILDRTGIYFFLTDFRFDDFKKFDLYFAQNKGESELIVFTHEWVLNVPLRKNIFLYLTNIYRRSQVIKNIETFFSWCSSQNYEYVTDFGV